MSVSGLDPDGGGSRSCTDCAPSNPAKNIVAGTPDKSKIQLTTIPPDPG